MQATGGQTNKSGEELREEMRPLAAKRVTRSLVLEKVAEEEKIKVSDDEIHAEMEKLAPNITDNKDELQKFLDSPQAHSSVEQLVARRKAIQRLVEIAGGSKKVRKSKE